MQPSGCVVLLHFAALLTLAAPAFGQGNESTTTAAESEGRQQGDAVEIGAGSTSSVTTGSSGPGSSANPTMTPFAPSFAVLPQPTEGTDASLLAVRVPPRLRCEIIGDANARKRCESRSSQGADRP